MALKSSLRKKSLAETHPEIAGEWHPTKNGDHMPADVTSGSNKKVWWKCPIAVDHEWQGVVEFYVLDNTITPDVFEHHLKESGKFIGIGRFRPINGGFYGRFNVEKIEVQEMDNELEAA